MSQIDKIKFSIEGKEIATIDIRKVYDNKMCKKCLRYKNERCTEITIDVFDSFPNCFLRRLEVD